MSDLSGVARGAAEAAMTARYSRRRFAGLAAGGALALGATLAAGREVVAQYVETELRTTAAVNLRADAGTQYAILAVVPAGATVTSIGEPRFGFICVKWNGLQGWISADYLVRASQAPGAPAPSTPSTPPVAGYPQTGTARVATNLRGGPSTGHKVLVVVPAGATVAVSTTVSSGFRGVSYNGTAGWMIEGSVVIGGAPSTPAPSTPSTPAPGSGQAMVTTTALNLRSSASTAAAILVVMPAGASVTVTGAASGGFLPVSWNGTSGWAASEYLRAPGAPSGGSGSGATLRTTTALNHRAQANANSALLGVVPAGATVTATGQGSAGYIGVSWNGKAGFVLGAYVVPA